jgi:hypothetical protein
MTVQAEPGLIHCFYCPKFGGMWYSGAMATIGKPTMTSRRRILQMNANSRPRPKRSASPAPICVPQVRTMREGRCG